MTTTADECDHKGVLNRRNMLLAGSTFATASALGSAVETAIAQAQQVAPSSGKPNILVIMGDDVGWFNIGADTGTPVDDGDYQVPFAFTGKINKLTFALDPPILTPDDVKKLEAAYRAAQDAN